MATTSEAELMAAVSTARKAYEDNTREEESSTLFAAYNEAHTNLRQFQYSKFNHRTREERLVDDAFCLVPFVSGVFRERGARNFYMVSPFLRLFTPKIDIKTGTWHIFTKKTLKECTKAMDVCNLSWHDALSNHTLPDKSVPFVPLAKILKDIQKIEDKIVTALTDHKVQIISNAKQMRTIIIENAASFYHNSEPGYQDEHYTALWDFITSSTRIDDSKSKHPFSSVARTDTQSFLCIDDLRKFLDNKFKNKHLKEEIGSEILLQETHRIENILRSMKAYKKMYDKFTQCIQGNPVMTGSNVSSYSVKTLTKDDLAKALYETKELTDCEESVVHEALNNIVQALLIERFELLSCHIHTYFSACIGNGDEVHKLANDFVRDAIWFCMADFFKLARKQIKTKDGDALSFRDWVVKMDSGRSKLNDSPSDETKKKYEKFDVIRLTAEWKDTFETIMKSVFESFKVVELQSSTGPESDYALIKKMVTAGFTCSETPEQLTNKCFPYNVFNKTSLDRINRDVNFEDATNGRSKIESLLKKCKKPGRKIELSNFCYDPVRDCALDYINKKLTVEDNPTYRYSFQIAKQILYANQCDVPSFVGMYLFDNVKPENRNSCAKLYLRDIHVPIVLEPESKTKPADYQGVHSIPWDTLPFDFTRMALKLNHSALTQSDKPKTPKKKGHKKSASNEKKNNQNVEASKPGRKSTTNRSTLEFGTGQTSKLTIHKKKKKLQTKQAPQKSNKQ